MILLQRNLLRCTVARTKYYKDSKKRETLCMQYSEGIVCGLATSYVETAF